MPSTSRLRIALVLLVLTGFGLVLSSALRSSAESPAGTAPATSFAPGEAGMRATIDPETGVLGVASGGELVLDAELQEALRRDTEGLEPVVRPDGTVLVHLQGRFQSASVARIGEDGKVVVCSENPDHLSSPAPAPAKAVER